LIWVVINVGVRVNLIYDGGIAIMNYLCGNFDGHGLTFIITDICLTGILSLVKAKMRY
jgi:hypothetical protein